MKRLALIMLVAITFAGAPANAAMQVLCARVHDNGTFNSAAKVRTACRANELQVDQSVIGFPAPIIVKDTNDSFVGAVTFAGAGGIHTNIVRLLEGDPVILQVNRAGFRSDSPEPRVYTSSDCSGQAYVTGPSTGDDLFYSGTVENGLVVYGKGSSTTITVSSRLRPTTSAECSSLSGAFLDGFCCTPDGPFANVSAVPAVVSDLNPLGFEAPFHAE